MDTNIDSKKTLEWCIDNSPSCHTALSDDGKTIVIIAKCDGVAGVCNIEAPFDSAAIGHAVLSAFSSVERGVKHYAKLEAKLKADIDNLPTSFLHGVIQ
jgi:hypothetical protein